MKPLTRARKARLGMTAGLCIAVAVGAGSALFNSHNAAAVRAEPRAALLPALTADPSPPLGDTNPAITGVVRETIAASQYTYLRVATNTGDIWAAVPSATLALGTQVTVENATRMTGFKSSTLHRTFDVIYFGTLGAPTQQATASRLSPAEMLDGEERDLPPGHPAIGNAQPGPIDNSDPLPIGHPDIEGAPGSPQGRSVSVPLALLPVAPAQGRGAHVISELTAQRAQLAGKRVRVRGQVTKVTPDVQGHTFFHLRDGKPGDPATDLVVTSNSTPERGQVATFEGTLRTDVDIGIGYSYPVLLENAVVMPE
jgi:hypothetical protein